MINLPPDIVEQRRKATGRSIAIEAAIAISQLDPHSREDLAAYISAMDDALANNDDDAVAYLIGAMAEVFESLPEGGDGDLDDWEQQAERDEQGRRATRQLDEEAKAFLRRYQALKAKVGLTSIREVAQAAQLSPTTVQAIETQKVKPQFRTLQKLAKGFGVPVEELL